MINKPGLIFVQKISMASWLNGIGVTLILIAFVLLSLKRIQPDHVVYKLFNFFGAGLACAGAWMIGAWAFVVLEGVWSMVALYSIFRK